MSTEWRDNKTASACLEHLYLSDKMADVHFYFRSADDRQKRPLPAHRFVLALRSPVFEAMFYGSLPESGDKIKIEDISCQVFKLFLRFLYTGSVDLDGDVVLHCLYAAKKYQVTGLVRLCQEFLKQHISPENVCTILEQARFYDAKDLQKDCLDFICSNPEAVIELNSFLTLSLQSLTELLSSSEFALEEIVIFKAVLKWAEEQCKTKKFPKTPDTLRTILGEALFEIRFPLMSIEDFTEHVVPVGILTVNEQLELFKFFGQRVKNESPVGGFKATLRHSFAFNIALVYQKQPKRYRPYQNLKRANVIEFKIKFDSNILVQSCQLEFDSVLCKHIHINSRVIPFRYEGNTVRFVESVPLACGKRYRFCFQLADSVGQTQGQLTFNNTWYGIRASGTAYSEHIRSMTVRQAGCGKPEHDSEGGHLRGHRYPGDESFSD